MNTQKEIPNALRLADMLGFVQSITPLPKEAAAELRAQHELIQRLKAALVEAAAESEDGAILDAMDARPHDCRGLDKTPQGWRVIPKGKLTHVLYKDLRSAMKSGLGIGGQS